ncbi:muscarinic acetylcholine receptor M3-like [Lytechinus pictus]|uniref:muscarinic acetylcholine receptor M3-like n=1 Tax=Lytechinus pictus TaxID=7653 RepID=UPI0030BA08F5
MVFSSSSGSAVAGNGSAISESVDSYSSDYNDSLSSDHTFDYSSSYFSSYTYEYPFSSTWLAIVPMVVSIFSVVTFIGNLFVILAYIRDKRIRASVANIFILNLAMTDIIVGALVWTINLSWLIKDQWILGEIFCKLWLVLDYSVVLISVWTMVLISWDRYCLLTMGMRYQTFQTKKRIGVILGCVWAATFIWYFILAFAWDSIAGENKIDYTDNCEMGFAVSFSGTMLQNVISFFIPFSVLIFFNLAVYANIKRRSRGVVGQSPPSNKSNQATQSTGVSQEGMGSSEGQGNSPLRDMNVAECSEPGPSTSSFRTTVQHIRLPEDKPVSGRIAVVPNTEERSFAKHRRAAIVLSILVGCFLICWLPSQVSTFMYAICGTDCVTDLTWEVTSSFVWSNSTINPFIYAATNKLFRRNFVHSLCLDRWSCDLKRCKVKRKR